MAAQRRQQSHLPSPPVSPSQQTPRPLPLPLPTEMKRYKTWQSARSNSMNVKTVPVPPLARRSATAPVIGTTSDQFIDYDRNSSPEPEFVPTSAVKPEVPSRYTTSYYHILGLPEIPEVTTEEIEEAFQKLVQNPSSHPSHHYDNLEQIRKTLTSSIRRRAYDHGRRAHLLHQSQLKDRELFEKVRNDSDKLSKDRERFEKMRKDCDKLSKAQKTAAQEIKAFTDDMRMKSLESELKMVKKEVAATFKRKVKNMGLSMSLDGLDEEEGVPWEEMDFGTRSSQIVGERMGLEFEFNGSGSEEDSGDEHGSEGTFSNRDEVRKEPRRSEESEQIKRLEEFEELSSSAMSGLFSKISSSDLKKAPIAPEIFPKDDQRKLDVKDEKLSASKEVGSFRQADSSDLKTISPPTEIISKSDNETSEVKEVDEKILNTPKATPKIILTSESGKKPVEPKNETQDTPDTPKPPTITTQTTSPPSIDTDLPDILNIIECLYPAAKTKKKKENDSYKEIWEFDYNSDSESDSDTESPPEQPQNLPCSSPSQTQTPTIHELPGSEIWELDYPNHNSNTNPADEEDDEEAHETIILFLQFVIVFSLATAAWGWFGGGWVLNLVLA
ncbi:uncharacterized protein Bfra_005875 [Botrytis fragariae]|uniref:J domain-containing protein n=1 Tax=Botrytis fragariae TaxID=1964551 RepID=A0A8H6ARX0_9HELO|nr:uncharacterized protein Bfra_005875 [Botrytis fragariae]KAF5872514.1 hypothetical protein Bfra_005875 [Botrytis fragariae]